MSSEKKASILFLWFGILLLGGLFAFALYTPTAKAPTTELTQGDIEQVLTNAPRRGGQNPKLYLVEFGDFQCAFCKEVSPILQSTLEDYGDAIQHIWIHAPSSTHAQAESASIAAQCAQEQGRFWEYHDLLFTLQDKLSPVIYNQIAQTLELDLAQFQACLGSKTTQELIRHNRDFADASSITATPTVVINQGKLSGRFTQEELVNLIEQELDNAS